MTDLSSERPNAHSDPAEQVSTSAAGNVEPGPDRPDVPLPRVVLTRNTTSTPARNGHAGHNGHANTNGHGAPPSEEDRADVRPLDHLRPVPLLAEPLPDSHTGRPLHRRPVYDPFSARRRRTPEWLVAYTAALVVGDTLAAATGGLLVGAVTGPALGPVRVAVAVSVLAWPVVNLLLGTYAERRLGTGGDEFRRVVVAGLITMAGYGGVAAVTGASWLDSLLLWAAPATVVLTLLGRWLNRIRLHRARRRRLMTKQAVLIGREGAVLDLARRIRRDPAAGLEILGACVPRPEEAHLLERHGVPVLGRLDQAVRVVDDVRADAVVVTSASETAGLYLRDLAWRLEGTNIELLVCPGLVEVAPARLQVRPTVSVPLLQVREPEFRGHRRLVKAVLDRTAAAVLLVAGSPLLLGIALAIRVTSRGPALYRHHRVGKCGRHFDLLKFRSMVVDADRDEGALMVHNEGNAVQFKLRRDPRVTAVGRFLRRYSLDELPQLVNVLKGEMSFVGPRPHVDREVEEYGPDMHRRLLVKPGITGLWQVSGRSNLSWDESVELDVRYVENWSLGLDAAILWRTVRAVLGTTGAY